MGGSWFTRPGMTVVAGSFGDIELHHHPAVQLAVGIDGPLVLVADDGTEQCCSVAAAASGTRHAMRPGGASAALSIYLGAETSTATTLNAVIRAHGHPPGLWAVDDADPLAAAAAAAVGADDLAGAAGTVVDALLDRADAATGAAVHPQVREAVQLVTTRIPSRTDLGSVAGEVAMSADHLGRLFRKQTGTSFGAMARWTRLLSALEHLGAGASITDAAHLAGFADGAHATRVCRELTGIAPSDVARALG
ncbi:helix-turn-helix transcriptional regulator [Mycolicibacterium sp. 050232]|uniref:helix-turn-helix transcriptional regulator n=1 Tax=Mycolicibacterium sp. 050232 TaxID=3113982 RepID=UPI002E28DD0F|nr:helix-turn-helix transcriptional regulator [Mycolicibacterium sp. 050232]MED5811537.1 helix-turn-helix transcriptional regulator [Mycolicibacterium sp. 050232]